ncbi:MAG: aryldialkylphosphatase, partial [Alphaproteobacteria bacterium]|nr:aryldialkylphosphatase [Alphaproteobacteria bacterium]
MTGRVQTVLGPVAPDAIGPTLMHEHLICDVTPPELAVLDGTEPLITLENVFEIRYEWGVNHLGNHRLTDEAVAIAELARLRAAGGAALVEVSGMGLRPDPAALARIARTSGVHVIAGCGPYVESYLTPIEREKSTDQIAKDMIAA